MRAIVVREPGGTDALSYEAVPEPSYEGDELLVSVLAAGVNFIDVHRRTGAYPFHFPHTPGIEGAGRVVAVGSDVEGFRVGELVAWVWVPNSYAEFVAVPARVAVHVPDAVDPVVAAAALLQGMTAHFLTESVYPVRQGDSVLVQAAAGGVGLLLTQMCVRRGAQVIGTTSRVDKADLVREAGASLVVRYDELDDIATELPHRVFALLPDGVHVAYDGVGKDTFDASLASLRMRGMLVLFGQSSGPVPPLDLQRLNAAGSLVVTRPNLTHFIATRAELETRSRAVFDAVVGGELDVRISQRFGLDQAALAHAHLESRGSSGKVMLVPAAD